MELVGYEDDEARNYIYNSSRCCYLLYNQQCDKLCPTAIDGSVLGQLSQPILHITYRSHISVWDFYFGI